MAPIALDDDSWARVTGKDVRLQQDARILSAGTHRIRADRPGRERPRVQSR